MRSRRQGSCDVLTMTLSLRASSFLAFSFLSCLASFATRSGCFSESRGSLRKLVEVVRFSLCRLVDSSATRDMTSLRRRMDSA